MKQLMLSPCASFRLMRRSVAVCSLGLCAFLVAISASAASFDYSGFASIVAGKTFGACAQNVTVSDFYSSPCTRYVADWAHGGVYTPDISLKPDSKVGLQGSLTFSNHFSATAQVVGRLADGAAVDLEWAYVTYDASPAWTFQVGRKRLPLYYFSASQDVGYTYPWVRLPPDIYGWDAVNYNGVNATYRKQLGEWSLKSNLFAGDETTRNSSYAKLSYNEPKDVKWENIRGADLELAREWFTTRLTYIVSDYQQIDHTSGEPDVLPSGNTKGKQIIYGIAVNLDINAWLVRSEYSVFDRSNFLEKSKAWMIGVGRRFGKFTPMVTASSYAETTPFPDNYTPVNWTTQALSLRYELTSSSALKFEIDRLRDGPNTYAGDANVIAMSYDVIF